MILSRLDQSAHIFWKAGATESGAGMQEFAADAIVETDPTRDLLDVGAGLFAEIGDFINERDLSREESVGCVFYQLRSAASCVENRVSG